MRVLQFYNSKTKQKEIFYPIVPGQVKMYVCGMTVYDYCHIGHGRMMACFDSLVRALRAMGYVVTYVRNITDIDDKIIKRANENHESIQTLTARFIEAMNEDARALHILPPDISPKATEYVDKMVVLIQQLIDKNLAYAAANGDVYYAINAFPAYGALSGQELDKLRSGMRVDVAEEKRDPLDFVLWKKAKPDEPSWPSPWGHGRPGWHIECSAMSCDLLGKHFDIHGGGMDLLFPHHENEVAQSVGAYDAPFVNTWLHCGFVQIDQEKMSKSLGNFFTIRDVLVKIPAEVLRYFLVASHYRSPLNFSEEGLQQAAQGLDRIYFALRDLPLERAKKAESEVFSEKFYAALADDFNAPEAFAVLFELVREINRLKSLHLEKAAALGKLCVELAGVFGIAQKDPQDYFQQAGEGLDAKEVDALIEKREQARKNKDWKTADQVRETLQAMGVVLEDTPQGIQWRYNKEN